MELNWLESFLYGLISGLTEFLPVSALAHQTVLLKILGLENAAYLRLAAHFGVLIALVLTCASTLRRLFRQWRLYTIPKKRRRRQPDFAALMEMRVFRTGTVMVIIVFLLYGLVHDLGDRLWVLAILLGINGIVLYVPQFLPSANKTAQSLSRLDAVLVGTASGLGVVPGISATGMAVCVAGVRGADRKYATELALLLSIPAILIMMVPELLTAVTAGIVISGGMILSMLIVSVASFFSAYWGIILIRFLAVKVGFSGFSYYCWGLALFTLILYLI